MLDIKFKIKKLVKILILMIILFVIFIDGSCEAINFTTNDCSSTFNSDETNPLGLETGDIAFRQPDLVPDNLPFLIDHCLIFVEYNKTSEMYIFVEASAWGVKFREANQSELFGDLWKGFRRIKIKYITKIQKQNAVDFAKLQVGKEFQGNWSSLNKNYNPTNNENDIFANEWYCSELVWAAYYNCNHTFPVKEPKSGYIYGEGIDIDPNGWNIDYYRPLKNHSSSIIYPKELYNRAKNRYVKNVILKENETAIHKSKDYNDDIFSIFRTFLNFEWILRQINLK